MVRKKASEYEGMTVSQLISERKVLQTKIDQIDEVLAQAAAALGVSRKVNSPSPVRREADINSDPTLITTSAPPPPQMEGLSPMGVNMSGPPPMPIGNDFNSFMSGDVSPAVRMIETSSSSEEIASMHEEITAKLRSIEPS